MGSKCKSYSVYLYLMRIMIFKRTGMGRGGPQMFYKEYLHLMRIAVDKRTKMWSKCKFYIVYLYLMGIMIINRSGTGVQMFSKVCLHLMKITIVKRTSTLISDLLLVFINYWRTQMKLLDIHFVSWWLKKNVDYLIQIYL